MKRLFVEISAILILIVSLCCNAVQRNERDRLRGNIEALTDELDYYMTADSVLAARTKRQSVTINELKADNSQLADEVKAMDIKLKYLQSIQKIEQQSIYQFQVDTVIVTDTVTGEPSPQYEYHDEWIDFRMLCGTVNIETRDSLTVVRYQRRRRFLFWTFKKFTGQVAVTNSNPNAKIVGINEIDIVD
ncbi:MAG: hypothetical protein IKO46_05885 [Salinivirgaceae bacterium]|nr:hypothetical protein [Salinivirgaceae bacterium]